MEQAATVREFSALAQRVAKVEELNPRVVNVEKAVIDMNKTAFRMLLAVCGHALLLLAGIILYVTGLMRPH